MFRQVLVEGIPTQELDAASALLEVYINIDLQRFYLDRTSVLVGKYITPFLI